LWYNSSELLLIGTVSDQLALSDDYLARLTQSSALQKDMEFSYWGGPEFWVNRPQVFAGGFFCGPRGLGKLTKGTPKYRDEVPWLEYSFSPHDSDQSLEIIDLLESVLEPAALNFDHAASAEVKTLTGQVQLLNLGDLRGSAASKQARIDLKGENLSSAIQLFQQAAESNPKSVEFLNNLGMALRASGDLRSAENQFRTVLDEDPRSSLALNNLGITLLEQRRTREAIRYLERAVAVKPDYEDAYFNLGNALLSARRPQEAVSNYKTAIALDPEDAVNYMALIRVLIMLKDTQQAKSYYLKVKKMAPHLTPPPGFADWAS
jgi:tetratricopeptide (TPR) repeat protein